MTAIDHARRSEGKRLTTLARRLGVTEQTVKQRVDELADFGLVERAPELAGLAPLALPTPRSAN